MAFVLTDESLEADAAVSPDSVAAPRSAERSDAGGLLELLSVLAKSLVTDAAFEVRCVKISNLPSSDLGA